MRKGRFLNTRVEIHYYIVKQLYIRFNTRVTWIHAFAIDRANVQKKKGKKKGKRKKRRLLEATARDANVSGSTLSRNAQPCFAFFPIFMQFNPLTKSSNEDLLLTDQKSRVNFLFEREGCTRYIERRRDEVNIEFSAVNRTSITSDVCYVPRGSPRGSNNA